VTVVPVPLFVPLPHAAPMSAIARTTATIAARP